MKNYLILIRDKRKKLKNWKKFFQIFKENNKRLRKINKKFLQKLKSKNKKFCKQLEN